MDVVDLISSYLSTPIKSKRWPINSLAFLLDTVRTNAKTIICDNDINISNFEFTYQLGRALILPGIQRRYNNNNGLNIPRLQKIQELLHLPQVNRRPTSDEQATQGRCHKFVEEIVGTENYKVDRKKLNNKLKSKCHKCNFFMCKDHSALLCKSAADE